ncbi:pre-mRNA-splicing factor ISY1 homolog isoform X1 [Capsicum annuum]|nr:pre-mRNA-splicing factor ISY1 homolog isoform X1 [Capsicum annuum]
MARNEEKAQSMLNRFITMKEEEKKKPKERRPYLASECRDLAEADKWRQQIMREIGRKVAEIQNEGLGEHRLRDLNDEINKLIREKVHWERRIIELGGPNYTKHSAKMTDLDGNIVDVPNPGGRGPGYRYFGAAKKLPGVRELFEKPPELRKRRTRYDIYKRIDASYYGYRDDEDGILEKLEGPAEEKMRAAAVREWMEMEEIKREAKKAVKSGEVVAVGLGSKILFEEEEDVIEEERMEREREEQDREKEFVVHVPLPDEKEIERMVVERKKMELISKYASEDLMEEQMEAKTMLNIQRPRGSDSCCSSLAFYRKHLSHFATNYHLHFKSAMTLIIQLQNNAMKCIECGFNQLTVLRCESSVNFIYYPVAEQCDEVHRMWF